MESLILNPLFYAIAVPSILIVGISKGGFGSGLGMLGVPAMSLVISPLQAAGILLPILCVMDLFGVWRYRASFDKKNLIMLIPTATFGAAFGWMVFDILNESYLQLLIGILALCFAMYYWKKQTAARACWSHGIFWGSLTGLTSFVAHAGGASASIFLLPQQLHKTVFTGTTVFLFTYLNYLKILPYWHLGLFDFQNLSTAFVLLPLAPLGMGLGIWLHHRVNAGLFYKICYALLALIGARLIYQGLVNF